MRRRRAALRALAGRESLDLILVCGENRTGRGVAWISGWPVTAEAVALFDPARPGVLFVQYHNHVPLARRLAHEFEVRWGGPATVEAVEKELKARAAKRVGVIGPWAAAAQRTLGQGCELVNLAYGQRITVIALPPPPVFLTPKGLQHVGPRAFGYDIEFRSVFQ